MSNNIKILIVLKYIQYTIVGVLANDCILEHNEFNVYPWLLKITIKMPTSPSIGQQVSSGFLVTPYKVISTQKPFKDILEVEDPDLTSLHFIGYRLKENGALDCMLSREAVGMKRLHKDKQLVAWVLKEGFDVSHRYPFIWTSLNDIVKVIKTKDMKKCFSITFTDRSAGDARIKLIKTRVIGSKRAIDGFKDICKSAKNVSKCIVKKKRRFVWATVQSNYNITETIMTGDVMVCDGHAIGSYISTLNLENKSGNAGKKKDDEAWSMYTKFRFHAKLYRAWAIKEWPWLPTPSSNTSDGTTLDMTTYDYYDYTTFTGTKPLSTTFAASSVIPTAKTIKLLTSKRTTKIFVRTLPRRVKSTAYVNCTMMSKVISTLFVVIYFLSRTS